jgi:hypothetical protein
LLKEIVGFQAAMPNWLAIREKEPNNYQTSIRAITIKKRYEQLFKNLIVQLKKAVIY